MPPLFGLLFLGIVVLVVGAICILPLLGVGMSRRLRARRSAWVWAGVPTALVLALILGKIASGLRERELADAVRQGDARRARRLLDAGVDADARTDPFDPYGSPTAIQVAIDEERWDLASLLIDRGATDSYLGDDTLYEQSAAGRLEAAGQDALARRLKRHGPPHF